MQEITLFGKFVTEVLIFRSNRSQRFFKIVVLENFAILSGKNLCWPLHTFFYRTPTLVASGFCGSKYFFQLNLVFISDSHTCFCPELLWKLELNVRSSNQNSVKKGVFRKFASFTGRQLC